MPELRDLLTREPVTAMALHHIADTDRLFAQFSQMLATGGWLAVADLCEEDRSFHAPIQVAHNGFSPDQLGQTIRRVANLTTCHWGLNGQMEKNGRLYKVFLLTAH